MSHLGVDLSNYNTNLNYHALRQAGVEFAYILMTDGSNFHDGMAPTHVKGCEAAGIKWGGYHFLRPEASPVPDQSVYYLNMLDSCGTPQLPSACDVETQDPAGWAHLSTIAAEWMSNIENNNLTPNELCLLYTNVSFAKAMPGWPLGRPAWLADPSNVAPQLPRLITQTGQRAFPSNPILDVNTFVGTEAQWSAFIGGSATPTPTPALEECEEMDCVVAPNGDIVAHYRTPQNHLLEVTRKAGMQGQASNNGTMEIVDITAQFPQFEVAS